MRSAKIGLIRPEDVVDACVIRQPKAYPVYDEDYAEHVAQIRRDLETSFPTLHLVGRNGMHKYNNQDHAMMTAILAARNILAGERPLRSVGRQRGRRIWRGRRRRRQGGAAGRAHGAAPGGLSR